MSGTSPVPFRVLGRDAIHRALPMRTCIDLMRETMISVSCGRAQLPLRTVMVMPSGVDVLGVMPGHLAEPAALGTKLVCIYPHNPARGISSHAGVVVMFDPETGLLRALLDAAAITALRTPAATAAASRALAPPRAGDLAVLGAGEQAVRHIEALALVHDLTRIRLWGRDVARAEACARAAQLPDIPPIEVVGGVREAVEGADLVCTVTSSTEPILHGGWIAEGTHVSLVGASAQSASEIDTDGVQRSRYFVDYRPSALAQAGELKRALEAGAVTLDHIQAEIGEVFSGRVPGRIGEDEITMYKSLGVAAQDLAASHAVYEVATSDGLGLSSEL